MGKPYKQLSFEERALLQRARSTVTREMARNGWVPEPLVVLRGRPRVAGGYRAVAAQQRACTLSAKPRVVRKLVVGSALFEQVVGHLRQGLSPEQIACTLGRMDEPVRLSHETIYTTLYTMPRGHLRARILIEDKAEPLQPGDEREDCQLHPRDTASSTEPALRISFGRCRQYRRRRSAHRERVLSGSILG